jgi:hypothetical protein
VTGNITGGNILGGANVNAVTHTGTTVSVTGNISGNVITAVGTHIVIPTGTSDPGVTTEGALYYNRTTNLLRIYSDGAWAAI